MCGLRFVIADFICRGRAQVRHTGPQLPACSGHDCRYHMRGQLCYQLLRRFAAGAVWPLATPNHTHPTHRPLFLVHAPRCRAENTCTAKADATAWAALGCVVAGTADATAVSSLGAQSAADGFQSCAITCPTDGGAFTVVAAAAKKDAAKTEIEVIPAEFNSADCTNALTAGAISAAVAASASLVV